MGLMRNFLKLVMGICSNGAEPEGGVKHPLVAELPSNTALGDLFTTDVLQSPECSWCCGFNGASVNTLLMLIKM